MFGLFALTRVKGAGSYLDVIALGDAGHCRAMMEFLRADGDRRIMQINAVLNQSPVFHCDGFEIRIEAMGSVAHCNAAIERILGGPADGLTERPTPGDRDTRILTRVVDLALPDDPVTPSDLDMGRLGVNRSAWRGTIPEARFSHKVRLESESERKAVPVNA